MEPATSAQALGKLARLVNKIGYPDRWRDYGPVVVARDDFVGNVQRALRFESRRDLAKIGKPLDRARVVHDAAHGERLLRPADERHQLSRRRAAAAALRPEDGRRARTTATPAAPSATSSRTASTTRAASSTRTATCATGGRSRTHAPSTSAPSASSTSTRSTRSSTTCTSTAELTQGEDIADLGGPHPRLDGVERRDRGQAARGPRRPHARRSASSWATRSGRARTTARENLRVRALTDPALAREVPRERADGEPAGVPAGLRVQAGAADGGREALPRLVALQG